MPLLKPLCSVSISAKFHVDPLVFHIQLEGEAGAEDSRQHGVVLLEQSTIVNVLVSLLDRSISFVVREVRLARRLGFRETVGAWAVSWRRQGGATGPWMKLTILND